MPASWKDFQAFQQGLGQTQDAVIGYINAMKEKNLKDQQFNTLKTAMQTRYGAKPSQPSGNAPQTQTSSQVAGQPSPAPQSPATGTVGADSIGPDIDMLRSMGVAPPDAMKIIQNRYAPRWTDYGNEQAGTFQAPIDEGGHIDRSKAEELIHGVAPRTIQEGWTEAKDENGKPITRTMNGVMQIKSVQTDNSGKPTGREEWKNVPKDMANQMMGKYDTLNKKQQEIVDKIGTYRLDPKVLYRGRGTDINNIMAAVSEKYPGYNSMEYPIRAKAAADFRSPNGVAGRNVTALNTAIGHMGDLKKAMDGLQNADVQLWNKIKNVGLTQAGDPRVVKFLTAANAVEGEVAKVFAGKAGTDTEINEWKTALSQSQSPAQLKAAVQTMAHLLSSRIATLNWQAEQNVGTKIPLLSPRARTTLQTIGIDPDEFENATETQHTTTAGDIKEGDGGIKYKFKGGDEYDQKNWEKVN